MTKKTTTAAILAAGACVACILAGTPALAATPPVPTAPSITGITITGQDRAVLSVTAQPGAVVRTKDATGTVIGVKMTGSTGTTQFPVALKGTAAVDVTQTKNGMESVEASANLPAPVKAEVLLRTPHAALVSLTGSSGWGVTSTEIFDETGKKVMTLPLGSKPVGRSFAAEPGVTHTYTVTQSGDVVHTESTFTVTGGTDSLAAPTASLENITAFDATVTVHGQPFAGLDITNHATGGTLYKSFDASGDYSFSAPAGLTYTLVQSLRSDKSEATVISVP